MRLLTNTPFLHLTSYTHIHVSCESMLHFVLRFVLSFFESSINLSAKIQEVGLELEITILI